MIKSVKTRLILDLEGQSGGFNMAADDYLASNLITSKYDAVLRFFRWSIPTISLGCHQLPNAVRDEVCHKLGWEVVYRPTGGRALLHDGDLSYSMIVRAKGDSYQLFRRLYERVGTSIVQALESLGLEASVTAPDMSEDRREAHFRAGICLDSRVRGEVTVFGKKVAAAAQHVYKNSLLQHGSIMISGDPGAIALVSRLDNGRKEQLQARLRSRAGAINDFLDKTIDINDFAKILSESIAKQLDLDLIAEHWSVVEFRTMQDRSTDYLVFSNELIEAVD